MRKLLVVLSVAGVFKRRGVGDGERDGETRFRDARGVLSSGYPGVYDKHVSLGDQPQLSKQSTYQLLGFERALAARLSQFGEKGHLRDNRKGAEACIVNVGVFDCDRRIVGV